MTTLKQNVENRAWLVARLRAEVVGPDPSGERIVPTQPEKISSYGSWAEFRKPKCQVNGEEMLWQDSPLNRYGAGILYPVDRSVGDIGSTDASESYEATEADGSEDKVPFDCDEKLLARELGSVETEEDYDVSLANSASPSAIGLSFLADLSSVSSVRVELVSVTRASAAENVVGTAGIYKRAKASIKRDSGGEVERSVWLRVPLGSVEKPPCAEFDAGELDADGLVVKRQRVSGMEGVEALVVSRPWERDGESGSSLRLLTATLVNRRADRDASADELAIFQAGIRVTGAGPETRWIFPYPEEQRVIGGAGQAPSDEGSVNRVLYREYKSFAIGHGCAADWPADSSGKVSSVWSDSMPAFETPAMTPDLRISDADGGIRLLKVSMRKLAGLDAKDSGRAELDLLVTEYQNWIEKLRTEGLAQIGDKERETAEELVARCDACLKRIRGGLDLLDSEGDGGDQARMAFRLANHAMLVAQLRGGANLRSPEFRADGIKWSSNPVDPDPANPSEQRGYWRPFQIAFLLMSLPGIVDPSHEDREIVDLIWFPTGGGKTEAYLGVTAFTIFFNRLSGRESEGCDVIMRYTLRLLTAQQFQRAGTLFCAMEHLRCLDEDRLGTDRFTLGLWVGGGTTPNTRADAVAKLRKLLANPTEENPFVLLQCPWCAAHMGPLDHDGGPRNARGRGRTRRNDHPNVIGYQISGQASARTVVYQCPDRACEFSADGKQSIPIATIDEDLIETPPKLLIGTVDKFAMLAWKPELRRFFGISRDGQHHGNPPSLIIQDELHLISGPLGTMVGAYETVIDRLCRDHGVGDIGPKIIASTATISRAREQIKHLYARKQSMLFPPSGLRSSDSFFARQDNGPGRMYLGILAPGYFSTQTTQARVYASLLQTVSNMSGEDDAKDPWWTLLCFFNSLRELGGAATLMVADVREYLRVVMDRHGWDYKTMRNTIASELTSRVRGDDIPKELAKLEVALDSTREKGKAHAVDVCLASNIIEVGVDLPRLSLMAIVGQPKSTSQYIQVSSRVGRGKDKPGLVVVLYGQSKPRDRSHYERFRSYHQKLYAQVEPTSVTPFSAPATERALQGLILSVVRQLGDLDAEGRSPRPNPVPSGSMLANLLAEILRSRADEVTDGEETGAVLELLGQRLEQWRVWDPAAYGTFGGMPENPTLMHQAGSKVPADWNGKSWPVMSSLRDVDASGEAEITDWFNTVVEGQGE